MSDRPLCKCHGEPMYRNKSNGGWRCAVKSRTSNDRSYFNRGWKTARLRYLAAQRIRVIDELEGLDARAVQE